jgi:4-hydroxyproline epimerase
MAREKFVCIDAHTCGNPVRLVREGGPGLSGRNMSEKRLHFLREYDHIRKGLMFEPRGHDMMSGSILYPPSDPANDLAVLFIETSGCLPMCGHGTIGTVTIAIQEGLVKPIREGELRLETPAGLVLVSYDYDGKRVRSVKITNVPSYLEAKNLTVDCPGLGMLTLDVAYGGNFYAIIDPQEHFPGIQHVSAEQLVGWSRAVRSRLNEQHGFVHPEDPSINGLSHVMWTGSPLDPHSTARNAVFYGDKAIDRSPCGTGTSARMAQWAAQGRLKPGDKFIHESYIGCTFTGTVEGLTTVKGKPAIIPGIEGWARVTGYNTILFDEDDPYNHGFQVI